MSFYSESIKKAIDAGQIGKDDRILVIGGGETDRITFYELGFKDVLITNLSPHQGKLDYAPYEWKYEDAENLSFPDESFDWAIEHAALHHLGSPHRGVLEMLRVSKKGIVAFEARDSFLMRTAIRLGITSQYELEPALIAEGVHGGYRNSPVPNYVTRWRESEIEKVVNSMYPAHKHEFIYFYGLSVPVRRFRMARSPILRGFGNVVSTFSPLLATLIGKQANSFGFMILKKVGVQPWMKFGADGQLIPDVDFLKKKYDQSKY